MLNDPEVQSTVVGTFVNAAGAASALYLWTQRRSDRYLFFWGLAWTVGFLRYAIHLPANSIPWLRGVEGGALYPLLFFFNVLGSYDLLPAKPWRNRLVVAVTAAILLGYGIAATALGRPIEMDYALAATVFCFDAVCLWRAYQVTGLSGHAFAAATLLCWSAWFGFGVSLLGRGLTRNILLPLFNIPLTLSLVVIALQRRGRQLAESEHTLQKIFDTAPTPLVIVRPPDFRIERANAVAFEMLGVSPESAIGKTAVELGVVPDPAARQAVYDQLTSGRHIRDHEMVLLRGGHDRRIISVNADQIGLESGPRIIYSFFDLTELRRAEEELRTSAAELRRLYIRLATVEEDERRELHAALQDRIGARLTALQRELKAGADLLSRHDASGAEGHFQTAREIVTETILQARELMAVLRPPALDDFGLVAALRTFAESQSARLQLPIQVTGENPASRPGTLVEGALFRIAHEAVVNAARHASASRVTVDIGMGDGHVVLTIEDDGIGFDPDGPGTAADHWGLKNMRERARAIGGRLELTTAPGAGTRVTAEAPLEAHAE